MPETSMINQSFLALDNFQGTGVSSMEFLEIKRKLYNSFMDGCNIGDLSNQRLLVGLAPESDPIL